MNTIEFTGDPMLQLEKYDNVEKYIFYLNPLAMDEMKSYSIEINKNIPRFLNDRSNDFILFVEGGIDEEGNQFPDTYIGINNTSNEAYPYLISAIYAIDFQYNSPKNGEIIFLKKL